MHVTRSVEVASLTELLRGARIKTQFGMVKTQLHVARQWNGAALVDLLRNDLAQAHKPVRRRSARSCGVRMNISIR